MAFRIERGESLRQAVKRLGRAELDRALAALSRGAKPPDRSRRRADAWVEAIHDARTSLKKTRALVRLVGPVVGKAAHAADDNLRNIGRELSGVRDGAVMLETFDHIRPAASRGRARNELAGARKTLEILLQARIAELAGTKRRALVAKLGRSREKIPGWAPRNTQWPSLSAGLVEGYRRCRARMSAAYEAESSDAFHAWRRAIKVHRYQIQALEPLWPAGLGPRRRDLEKMADLLGEEHDLAVLAQTLRDRGVCSDGADDERDDGEGQGCRGLLATLRSRQRALRAAVHPLGERLFAEKPKRFGFHVRAYLAAFLGKEGGVAEGAAKARA